MRAGTTVMLGLAVLVGALVTLFAGFLPMKATVEGFGPAPPGCIKETSGGTPIGFVCGFPTATPTQQPLSTPNRTPIWDPVCGDVSQNGEVDATDAQLVLQYAAALVSALPDPIWADVNDDGRTDPVDAALILQFDAGLVPLSRFSCS